MNAEERLYVNKTSPYKTNDYMVKRIYLPITVRQEHTQTFMCQIDVPPGGVMSILDRYSELNV